MYTTTEAATILGMSLRMVQRHIQDGHIQTTRYGRDYLIDEAELTRFQQERRKAGRPRTRKTRAVEITGEE